ncbi:hypothetical protein ABZW10_14695 [Kitasatospora sp. NPDC004723]|uniref:hypothetical protein n=1 Tax=Kitasatospora sp. NPDC004723 TaxID=3154288 RepID=UPI0033A87A94
MSTLIAADAIAKPNLPSGGSVIVSYGPVLGSAHRVGRALHLRDNPELGNPPGRPLQVHRPGR